VNWSVTTRIGLNLFDSSSSLMKFIPISLKGCCPVALDINLVCLLYLLPFAFCYLMYSTTYFALHCCHLSHMKFLDTNFWIWYILQWPTTCESQSCLRLPLYSLQGLPINCSSFLTSNVNFFQFDILFFTLILIFLYYKSSGFEK